MDKKRVIVGMSGGVDSSVAAALLKREGYDVAGVIMEIYDDSLDAQEGHRHACFGPGEKEDLEDARNVAERLDMPLYTVDLREQYKERIINYFVREYLKGKTPNPCTKCNREMKFGAILDQLRKQGIEFDYFATGHYARIEKDPDTGRVRLKKALDPKKDQSYFLYHLKEEQLKHFLFPLGNLKKDQVREIAGELGITVAEKPESQDFVAGGYHQLFDDPGKPGPILDTSGKEIGRHKGLVYYTIGQRRGIGIGGTHPLYVVAKDPARNAIIVGVDDELMAAGLVAGHLSWVNDAPTQPFNAEVKIRYIHTAAEAAVTPTEDNRVTVRFSTPQRAVTPGQVVVFYDGDVVLGGGVIEKELK